jgi:WD40 repeat protein
MLVLQTNLRTPNRLMFSPDGHALLATEGSTVQLWPRWLDAKPKRPKKVQSTLERCALSPTADRVFLYVSGNSHTRVLDFKSGEETETAMPSGGPSWFHFDAAGGFFLVSHDRGRLTRYDLSAKTKSGVRKRWSIERRFAGTGKGKRGAGPIGSHYAFGAICPAAGTFVALEYRYGGSEPFDGLVVRSVAKGEIVYREPMTAGAGNALKDRAGLTLSIHPSGRYFAYPHDDFVRFKSIATGFAAPADLAAGVGAVCRAVCFSPSGHLLAAVGDSGTAVLYDTATWQVVREFAWGLGALRAVCFSPDGTRAAAIAEGSVPAGRKQPVGRAVVWDLDV